MWENEIVKENNMLQKKYEALMQEIEEKSKLIDNAIENKSSTNEELEKKIELDIEQQEKVVEEQIEIYKTQTEAKNKEREELNKILKDYKSKYGEFRKPQKKPATTTRLSRRNSNSWKPKRSPFKPPDKSKPRTNKRRAKARKVKQR